MQQKVKGNFLRVHDLLGVDCKPINISVLELALNQQGRIKAWDKVLSSVSALPGVSIICNLFRLVVHIIDRRSGNSPLQEVKGTKHGIGAKVHNINLVVIILKIKAEFCLANSLMVHIEDEVVID